MTVTDGQRSVSRGAFVCKMTKKWRRRRWWSSILHDGWHRIEFEPNHTSDKSGNYCAVATPSEYDDVAYKIMLCLASRGFLSDNITKHRGVPVIISCQRTSLLSFWQKPTQCHTDPITTCARSIRALKSLTFVRHNRSYLGYTTGSPRRPVASVFLTHSVAGSISCVAGPYKQPVR